MNVVNPAGSAASNADDPAIVTPARVKRPRNSALRLDRLGTLLFFLLFFAAVGIHEGTRYLSFDNALLVMSQNVHLVFAATAITITLIAGQFDLSVGALVGFASILLAALTAYRGVPLGAALVIVIAVGCAIGLLNGVLVTHVKVNAFIATLATGGALGGMALLVSGGQVIYEGIPSGLVFAGREEVLGVAVPNFYALILLGLGIVLTRRTLLGRRWYALGGNVEAARLAGVSVRKNTVYAFVVGSLLASVGGVIFLARYGSADPSTGMDMLLPAFAAAFLGSSILSDGRFNVLGTVLATFLIAYASNGIEVLGLDAGVKPIFNGAVLVGAVAVTSLLRRRSGASSSGALA